MDEKPLSRPLAHAETVTLVLNWGALMALSLILAFAADIGGAARPGVVWVLVIAGAAAFKSRIVLRSYLGLARAPGALAGFFTVAMALLGLVAASFVIFPTPQSLPDAQGRERPAGAVPNFLIHSRSN
jgi:hypothetical protein